MGPGAAVRGIGSAVTPCAGNHLCHNLDESKPSKTQCLCLPGLLVKCGPALANPSILGFKGGFPHPDFGPIVLSPMQLWRVGFRASRYRRVGHRACAPPYKHGLTAIPKSRDPNRTAAGPGSPTVCAPNRSRGSESDGGLIRVPRACSRDPMIRNH